MLSALAHRMLRDHVHLWITFVFVSNACVSLGITKTSAEDHARLLAFHRFTLCVCVYVLYSCLLHHIARMSLFSGQCERLSRRLVTSKAGRQNTRRFTTTP
jgi:hypothetical protein